MEVFLLIFNFEHLKMYILSIKRGFGKPAAIIAWASGSDLVCEVDAAEQLFVSWLSPYNKKVKIFLYTMFCFNIQISSK